MIPGNHAFQQSRNRAVEYEQPTLTPVGEATSGLSCKGWAYVACSDAARPVPRACPPNVPTTPGTFYQNTQPPQEEAVQPRALVIGRANQMLRRASPRVQDFDLGQASAHIGWSNSIRCKQTTIVGRDTEPQQIGMTLDEKKGCFCGIIGVERQ